MQQEPTLEATLETTLINSYNLICLDCWTVHKSGKDCHNCGNTLINYDNFDQINICPDCKTLYGSQDTVCYKSPCSQKLVNFKSSSLFYHKLCLDCGNILAKDSHACSFCGTLIYKPRSCFHNVSIYNNSDCRKCWKYVLNQHMDKCNKCTLDLTQRYIDPDCEDEIFTNIANMHPYLCIHNCSIEQGCETCNQKFHFVDL